MYSPSSTKLLNCISSDSIIFPFLFTLLHQLQSKLFASLGLVIFLTKIFTLNRDSSIYAERRTGDKSGARRTQVKHCAGNLFWPASAFHRLKSIEEVAAAFFRTYLFVHGRVDHAWTHHVDPHPL